MQRPRIELQIQKPHQSQKFASVPLIPKFARECAARACELRNRDTSRPGRNVKRRRLVAALAPSKLSVLRRRAEMVCHGGAKAMSNFTLRDLEKRVHERAKASAHASYTRRLLDQGVAHCAKKLGEEAIETVLAAV